MSGENVTRPIPQWFSICEEATPQAMRRIASSVSNLPLAPQVRSAPLLAHWFLLDSMLLANQANREGMHANALALTRQCLEAACIIELGVCGHDGAESLLFKWEQDHLTPGNLRAWLECNVWPNYGNGLWNESWNVFMREFAAAIQPYSHYSSPLAQWQLRFHGFKGRSDDPNLAGYGLMEIKPRAYDPQKATRITLFAAILTFALGRIWMAANSDDKEFAALINRLRLALGRSKYLDGHQTDWSQQFWTMLWDQSDGGTILE